MTDTLCTVHPAVVNGGIGMVNTVEGEPFSVIGFTIADDRITAIDILSDQARLARLDLTAVLG
ncbi:MULTISPECIES: hypothetical protein [Gordonia]|mgnify:CR=1 FL=1|uniref:hypothetical protein n=1 Tax=Gordonia TaxID=2053 RepID=UPI0008162EB3|nr:MULTISPECIES: hypothetical protein [Gordonia]MBR7193247.1 hypothetical protein [Gordonia sp. SCSIO 19800]UPG66505.1 hypothetical protein MVF96_13355 [Gordonia hongkongensis]SCC53916.1 RNA polymerase sigma-70 factor, ECF subfamily [Gordonia sp. v-85]